MSPEPDVLARIARACAEEDNILLVAHVAPDGDSLGSLLAFWHAFQSQGKEAHVFVPDGVPAQYKFLPGTEQVITDAAKVAQNEALIIALDCGEWDRLGLPEHPFRGWPIINIDHHRTSRGLGYLNLIDSEAAATGELVLSVLRHWGISISRDIATCIYTSIVSDTGFFRHSNTKPDTHEIAAELLRAGAQQELVSYNLMSRSFGYLQATARVTERLQLFSENRAALSYITLRDLEQLQVRRDELEGLIDLLRSLSGIEVACFLIERDQDIFKVGLRSHGTVDVSELAGAFGGGGHARAAGCTLQGGLERCVQVMKTAIMEGLQRE